MMQVEEYRRKLLAKEQDLLDSMAHLEADASGTNGPEVEDDMDRVVRAEAEDELLRMNSLDFSLLNEVRQAIGRCDAGTYGRCLRCGRLIEEKRLEALPWASLCLRDQEEADRASV